MALSTFSHLMAAQHLRSGEGERVMLESDSRRQERLFGVEGSGRLTTHKLKGEGECAGPSAMTCVEAYAALLDANPDTQ